ncbi:unnamed protein product [Sphagnum jensenii]|uniref:Uncharacterized protein n=1 Tax=Sphagnum jensenii TaxID=128206 RepID=A0ABP1AB83_9BRYO
MDLAIIRLKRKKVAGKGNTRSSSAVSGPSFEATSEAGADATDSISVSDRQAQILWKTDCKQVQHRQQSKIAPEQWMVSQNCARVHDFKLHLSHGNRRFDSKSRRQKQASNKHKGHCFSAARVRLVDKFRDGHSVEEEDGESEGLDENIKIFERLLQRSALEEEVLLLHKRLEEELELHSVLETAVAHVPGTLTSFPYHLPIAAQELLADIAVLEVAVLKLKERSTALRSQVVQEQTKREIAELHRERSGPILQPKGQGSPVPPPSPQQMIICADSQCNRPSHALVTPEQPEFLTATSVQDDKMFLREPSDLVKTPNQLSERMVHSMVSIYCHLAVQNVISGKSSPSGSIHSPTSPFGHQSNSSASSLSESSLVSFVRSPLVDLRNEEVILADATLDPFKVRNNIPWMDIGAYGHVFEVPRLSLDEDQLNYVAQALQDFKLLVEQLASVDPSHLSHDEKLAFWINLYNTLMMDGYLTYGIPQSELKFFSLLQKVAYTVGGHLFSAAMIEYSLLKSKSSATHPQIMLSMALHRNKFTEAQRKFGIDRPEPLINFALCCGTWSAPMVRIYTAEKVHMQLEDAFHNYTQASVGISTTGKLLVPKLLQCYAQNFVEDSDLLDWICNLLPSSQVDIICECIQQQHHHIFGSSNITIVPFNFTFRYLFHADIARTLMSL